jgi:hypothetical protein
MAKPSKTSAKPQSSGATVTIAKHWRDRFKANLAKRFFLRLHMSLILMTTGLAGFIVNRVLLWFGVESMPVRYGLAVLAGYGVFLLCIRLWLRYVAAGIPHRPLLDNRPLDTTAGDVVHGVLDGLSHPSHHGHVSWPGPSGGGGSPVGDAAGGTFFGAGDAAGTVGQAAEGTFLGGGAPSSSIGEAAGGAFWSSGDGDVPAPGDAEINAAAAAFLDHSAVAEGASAASSGGLNLPSGGGGGGGFDLDLGDDAGAAVAIIALVVIVLVVCGAGVYLIWEAPMILSDAAFQVVMTWAVRRRAGEIDDVAWVGSIVKATVWPFAIVLALTVGIGWFVQVNYPDVHSLGQLLNR